MGVQGISFSISGATITRHARDLVLSGKWREGVAYLKDAIEGFTLDHAVSVLEGSTHLTGDSGGEIFLEDDSGTANYRGELDDMFGDIVRIDGGLYRPSSVVTDYGDRDMRYPRQEGEAEFVPESFHDLPSYHLDRTRLQMRAMHYAIHPASKVVFCDMPSRRDPGTIRSMAVLFQPVPDIPLWVLPKTDPGEVALRRSAVIAYDGFQRQYGSDDLESEKDSARMEAQAKLNFAEGFGSRTDPSMKRALEENLETARQKSPEFFDRKREAILEQNEALGFGFRKVDFGGRAGVRKVPLAPLTHWAVNRGWPDLGHLLPDWKAICPQGVKLYGDNPVHSDWVVGAGLEDFLNEVDQRQDSLMAEIQNEILGLDTVVLVATRTHAEGRIVYATPDTRCGPDEIAVIPDAGPKYYEVAKSAAAVITLKGGAMSHLAQVGLEEGFLIVRVPDAKWRYPEGSVVHVDGVQGKVEVVSYQPAVPDESDAGMHP